MADGAHCLYRFEHDIAISSDRLALIHDSHEHRHHAGIDPPQAR